MVVRVLVVAGSTRAESLAKKLGRAAVKMVEQVGSAAIFADLRDFPMPLYDGDLEAGSGLPAAAMQLRKLMLAHDALLFAAPEYNASISAVLKNAIDWLSRPVAAEPGVSPFKNKVAGLLSSSPGALGGLRGLVHLRQVLMNVGCLVVTEQFALGNAASAFASDGSLVEGRQSAGVLAVVQRLVHVAGRLGG